METESFGLIVATHGGLGKGYISTLELILDMPLNEIEVLSFQEGETLESFEQQFQDKIDEMKTENLVILLDLPGGTPSNIALRFLHPNHKLIAGFNLPLLLEVVIAKMNHCAFEELNVQEIMEHAKDSMMYYNDIFNNIKGEKI